MSVIKDKINLIIFLFKKQTFLIQFIIVFISSIFLINLVDKVEKIFKSTIKQEVINSIDWSSTESIKNAITSTSYSDNCEYGPTVQRIKFNSNGSCILSSINKRTGEIVNYTGSYTIGNSKYADNGLSYVFARTQWTSDWSNVPIYYILYDDQIIQIPSDKSDEDTYGPIIKSYYGGGGLVAKCNILYR